MRQAFARLRAFFSPAPAHPPLVAVGKRYAGATIEDALYEFEKAWSDENFQKVVIQETFERADGTLARYEVHWKYSVLDDGPYSTHVAWARLVPADPGAGDPAGVRFYVAAAEEAHHMREMKKT